jgi:hypothetical protein
MLRTYFYLIASGLIWLVEGFLFSYYLGLAIWQSALLLMIYAALFAVALRATLDALSREPETPEGVSAWRLLAFAPAFVAIVGSFLSLPLILLVVALGRL